MTMDEYFERKSDKNILGIDNKIKQEELEIISSNDLIEQLSIERFKEEQEYFCGNHIILEDEGAILYGTHYLMAIYLSSMTVRVDIHPDSLTLGKTYIAMLYEWGVNRKYLNCFSREYPRILKGIETFEEAKEIGLGWLKELIETDNLESKNL